MRSIRTTRVRERFLNVLADSCNVSAACRAAGVARSAMYEWRDEDPEFAAAWREAEEQAADELEQVAWDRARSGLSDRMLEILLKAHRPKYREKQAIEHTGKNGAPITIIELVAPDHGGSFGVDLGAPE